MLVVETVGAPPPPRRRRRRPKESEAGRRPGAPAADPGHRGAGRGALRGGRGSRALAGGGDSPPRTRSTPSSPRGSPCSTARCTPTPSASADPLGTELRAERAATVRIGHGSGKEVAAGRFSAAREVDVRGGRKRAATPATRSCAPRSASPRCSAAASSSTPARRCCCAPAPTSTPAAAARRRCSCE